MESDKTMELWLLRPIDESTCWTPWYDKAFGFVVRAETEDDARHIAASRSGDEEAAAWLDDTISSCVPPTGDGEVGVVMRDFCSS